MNKLAINSFLAVTAMAWLGQPAAADIRQVDHEARAASEVFVDERGSLLRNYRFTPGERILLNEFRAQHARPVSPAISSGMGSGKGLPPGTDHGWHPGTVLRYEQMREARVLPGELRTRLDHAGDSTLDLFIGGRIVRLLRDTREIVDILEA